MCGILLKLSQEQSLLIEDTRLKQAAGKHTLKNVYSLKKCVHTCTCSNKGMAFVLRALMVWKIDAQLQVIKKCSLTNPIKLQYDMALFVLW